MTDPTQTTTRTPFPPGRICPECGSPVSRHDGLLYCIPRVGCPRDELAAWEREQMQLMATDGDEDCITALRELTYLGMTSGGGE